MKANYMGKDLCRLAEFYDIPINQPKVTMSYSEIGMTMFTTYPECNGSVNGEGFTCKSALTHCGYQ